jgi:hypothetical protein
VDQEIGPRPRVLSLDKTDCNRPLGQLPNHHCQLFSAAVELLVRFVIQGLEIDEKAFGAAFRAGVATKQDALDSSCFPFRFDVPRHFMTQIQMIKGSPTGKTSSLHCVSP